MAALVASACGGPFDLTAPTGAILVISANPTTIALFTGRSTITARITKPDGSAALDGTLVTFTTTTGTIAERVETKGGVAKAELVAGDRPGTADVTATSGTIVDSSNEVTPKSATVSVQIGSTPNTVNIVANPTELPPIGGVSLITAVVTDASAEPAADVPVTFSTTAGELNPDGAVVRTDGNGKAKVRLRTTVSATVTATVGSLTVVSVTVDVNSSPPVPVISFSPTTPSAGKEVRFSAIGTTAASSIRRYDWEFGDGAAATGVAAANVYANAGDFVVTLSVTDTNGLVGVATAPITVGQGEPPIASFTFSPGVATAEEPVLFDGSSSTDPDGQIVEYSWGWGDGTSGDVGPLPTAQHIFSDPGSYTVQLTVRDDQGLSGSASQTVTVPGGNEPTASFTFSPSAPALNQTVTFDGGSSTDEDGTIVQYSWNFGDGTSPAVSASPIATHAFTQNGSFTVTLTVTDNEGLTGTASSSVTLGGSQAPTASFTFSPSKPSIGQTVTFNSSASFDPDGQIVEYTWDWGDGSSPVVTSSATTQHSFSAAGTFSVKLTVRDNDGLVGDVTVSVTVS